MARARDGYVFLSHSGPDTQAAHQLAQVLRRNGLEVWFDKDDLQPGDRWMATLEQQIHKARCMIVYIGRLGVEAWVDREVRLGLVRSTQEPAGFSMIPVLGAGADPSSLPPFLVQHQWIDLRDPHNAPQQVQKLLEVLRTPSEQGVVAPEYWITHSPFRSLQVFTPEDAWLFFGRDSDTDELLSRLGRAPLLAVLGNSGSGKSSLLGAGLIPALQCGRFRIGGRSVDSWRVAMFHPSGSPFDYLAEILPAQIAPELSVRERAEFVEYCRKKLPSGEDALRTTIAALAPKDTRILLVADQFEELFTLTHNRETRQRYIDSLLSVGRLDGTLPVHLVIVLRADFYAQCLEHPELSLRMSSNLYNLPQMSSLELRETIEKRLALASAYVEPGLIDSLLADVGTDPGNLALLEHALDQLWKKRTVANTLTNYSYIEIGRLRGSLGRHADSVYREISHQCDERLIQRIFLELVQLSDGAQDLRRRVPKQDLLRLGIPEQVEEVLSYLASSHLILIGVLGTDPLQEAFVEVSHEALIRDWPALREWIAQNRDDLRIERRLLESAEEWQRFQRDPDDLLRGTRLAEAQEWLAKHPTAHSLIRAFVKASGIVKSSMVRASRDIEDIRVRVFLCHSQTDKVAVRDLHRRLCNDGFDPWLDEEEILPGEDWDREVRKAVRACHAVVVCLSASSTTKEGYVQKEIKLVLDVAEEKPQGTIFVIPARLSDCDVPERLRIWQWVDLFDSHGYFRLVASLHRRASQLGARSTSIENVVSRIDNMSTPEGDLKSRVATLSRGILAFLRGRGPRPKSDIKDFETVRDYIADGLRISREWDIPLVEDYLERFKEPVSRVMDELKERGLADQELDLYVSREVPNPDEIRIIAERLLLLATRLELMELSRGSI